MDFNLFGNKNINANLKSNVKANIKANNDIFSQSINKTKDTFKQGYNSYSQLSVLTQTFTLIIGVLLLVLVGYLIYYLIQVNILGANSAPMLISSPVNAFDANLSANQQNLPEGNEGLAYSYNFWIYIADWQYKFGSIKTIFIKGNEANPSPHVYLHEKNNALGVRIATFASKNEGCDIENIPLQKWVNVSIVLDNRTNDIYINGKLERSCVLKGVPKFNKSPLIFGKNGGFYGQLSKVRYFNRALTPDEIYGLYSNGP